MSRIELIKWNRSQFFLLDTTYNFSFQILTKYIKIKWSSNIIFLQLNLSNILKYKKLKVIFSSNSMSLITYKIIKDIYKVYQQKIENKVKPKHGH